MGAVFPYHKGRENGRKPRRGAKARKKRKRDEKDDKRAKGKNRVAKRLPFGRRCGIMRKILRDRAPGDGGKERQDMDFAFISDLDGYFCEKYADYDRICILKGYVMPKMQTTERREDGTDYSYTLPASTMRLALQEKREDLLAQLKEKMWDSSFSFSFRPLGLIDRCKERFAKDSFYKHFPAVLNKYGLTPESARGYVDVDEMTWKRICKGGCRPTKNLLFTLAISAGFSLDDLVDLLNRCDLFLDYTEVKDTVIAYLLSRNIHNPEMVRAALEEYKVGNLFFPKAEKESASEAEAGD